jgi:hypothetical protein
MPSAGESPNKTSSERPASQEPDRARSAVAIQGPGNRGRCRQSVSRQQAFLAVLENVHELLSWLNHSGGTLHFRQHARLQPVWLRDFKWLAPSTKSAGSGTAKSRTPGPRFDGHWFTAQSAALKVGRSITLEPPSRATAEPGLVQIGLDDGTIDVSEQPSP